MSPDVVGLIAVRSSVERDAVVSELGGMLVRSIATRRTLSMLDSLLANVPLSVYVKDHHGRHVAVSDAMIDMLGPPFIENEEGKRHHHPVDVLGKSDFDLYEADLAVETAADERRIVETGEPIEERIEDAQNEQGLGTLVATSKAPWHGPDGDLWGIVGVTRDIKERKHYEYQLERQNERLRRLTTMVSHDVRNPLSVAVGRLELARETGADEHFVAIEHSLDRIETLLSQLLDVIRQGEPVTEPERLSLATTARDVWESLDPVEATLRTDTDATIDAEPSRLGRLFEVLFDNACEHGRDAATPITVTVGSLADGFYVEDDGEGIPPDERESLFDPGLSAADSSGVGLNVAAAIADAHNWTVNVTDSDAGGARFEFRGVRRIDAADHAGQGSDSLLAGTAEDFPAVRPPETRADGRRPTVLLSGTDAASVRDRWDDADRPFDLVTDVGAADQPEPATLADVDCAVVEVTDDQDVDTAIERIRGLVGDVPVIFLAEGPIADPAAIAPAGAAGQVTVPPDCDRIAVLSGLAERITTLVAERRDRSMLDSLLANIPLSVYVKDRQSRHVAASDRMIDLFDPSFMPNAEGKRHHHPADVLGKSDFDLHASRLAAEAVADDRSVIETGEPIENRLEHAFGPEHVGAYVMTAKAPWYDRTGAIRGVVGVSWDVSERKHYEHQLERQNERFRRLATLIGEGVRSPLSVAIGRLELARETGADEHFVAVDDALAEIESIVSEVLRVARQSEPVRETDRVALADVAREVFDEHPVGTASLVPETTATVRADPGRLRLLFEQLFATVSEYGRDEASTPITVTVGDLEDGFYVAEEGVAITEEGRDAAVDPGVSRTDRASIGLSIVTAVADAHNWTVDVADDAGGTRFEFRGVDRVPSSET